MANGFENKTAQSIALLLENPFTAAQGFVFLGREYSVSIFA